MRLTADYTSDCDLAKSNAPIPEYKRIIAFRNILIHAYAEIDDRIVWDVADREVPELRTKAAELLAKP